MTRDMPDQQLIILLQQEIAGLKEENERLRGELKEAHQELDRISDSYPDSYDYE